MPFSRLERRVREAESLQDKILDRCSHLSRARHRFDCSDTCAQPRKRNYPHALADELPSKFTARESPTQNQEQHCPRGQILMNGASQWHRHAHRRGGDHIGNFRVIGRHNVRLTDKQFAIVTGLNTCLQSLLNDVAKERRIQSIDTPIHESETIRRADNRITFDVEDGTVNDFDTAQIATRSLPCGSERGIDGGEDDFQGGDRVLRF